MSDKYTYEGNIMDSPDVSNPMVGPTQPQTNAYTNNEINNSLDPNDPQHNNGNKSVLNGDDYDPYNGYGY